MKRLFDIVFSLPVVVILLPVFAVIAIAIRLTSKGPVIQAGKGANPLSFVNSAQ